MAKRAKLSKSGSKRLFSATANKAHVFNRPNARPMRGGTRL